MSCCMMDYSKNTIKELISICKERNIKGYSNKKKDEIVKLLATMTQEIVSVETEGKLKMIDLFAGTGAFSLAFEATNKVNTVFANDMVDYSKKIYDQNFRHKLTLKNLNDIKVEDIPPHDILTGGFPCQPFSIAGLQEGFKDERSNVFWKILSIIDYHHPKCVILENVKNLVSHDDRKTFQMIKLNLEQRGYHVCHKVLNTAQITGIPQHRERIYIVCIKSKTIFDKFTLDFPTIKKKKYLSFSSHLFLLNIIIQISQVHGTL
jgi:DNA (cytosine-5)-methyltransferase 1